MYLLGELNKTTHTYIHVCISHFTKSGSFVTLHMTCTMRVEMLKGYSKLSVHMLSSPCVNSVCVCRHTHSCVDSAAVRSDSYLAVQHGEVEQHLQILGELRRLHKTLLGIQLHMYIHTYTCTLMCTFTYMYTFTHNFILHIYTAS